MDKRVITEHQQVSSTEWYRCLRTTLQNKAAYLHLRLENADVPEIYKMQGMMQMLKEMDNWLQKPERLNKLPLTLMEE